MFIKKLFSISILFLVFTAAHAQDVQRTIGLGLQATMPTFGISAKYAITPNHMVQATIAPFGGSSGIVSYNMNFYGGRYIYRFPANEENRPIIDPYLFGGLGITTFKYKIDGLIDVKGNSFLSYNVGGGLEWLAFKKIGFSGEVGYGKMSVVGGVGVSSLIFGCGLHYYAK